MIVFGSIKGRGESDLKKRDNIFHIWFRRRDGGF